VITPGRDEFFFTMSDKIVYLTEDGLKKLKDELSFLKTTERRRIIQAIADARAHGDLSENAEYDAAKDAQGLLEAKIAGLEITAQRARLLDESLIDASKAFIMSRVKVKNHNIGKELTYTLVSAQEADFTQKKISVDSPIGKALLGKSVGDVVEVSVPAGKLKLEVLDLER
jgi:transcription elongation factor GreA